MDDFSDLALFMRVLDLGSVSAAARSLDLPVAVASRSLKQLECRLGVRLLQRTSGQLHPTPEGLKLVEDWEAVGRGLGRAGAGLVGTLRVTMPSTFGRLHISPLLPEFLTLHPGVRVCVDLNDFEVDLASAEMDLAIRIGTLDGAGLVARKLATSQQVLCASPDYLDRRGAPAKPADLLCHECLLLVSSQGRNDTWRLQNGYEEVALSVNGCMESNESEVLRQAAIAGVGIAMHSTWHVNDDLRAGRLQIVLPDYPLADTDIHVVMPPQCQQVRRTVRVFVDFLADRLGGVPPWERAQAGPRS